MIVTSTTKRLKDGQQLVLRSPTIDDAKITREYRASMSRESWRQLNRHYSSVEKRSVEDMSAWIVEHNENAKCFIIQAYLDDTLVGDFGLRGDGTEFLTAHCATLGISVLERYQGLGIARAMFELAFDEALKIGITNLHLRVRTPNIKAIGLYESLGFRRVGLLEKVAFIDGAYTDEYYYQKLLA